MNRKSLAITASLFAATLAVPPPFTIIIGIPLFTGLKLYKTSLVFLGVALIFYSGQLIGFISSGQFSRLETITNEIAHSVANATMADPSLFPYVAVSLFTTLALEIIIVLGLLIFPAYLVRKKVYPHVKQQLGHET